MADIVFKTSFGVISDDLIVEILSKPDVIMICSRHNHNNSSTV